MLLKDVIEPLPLSKRSTIWMLQANGFPTSRSLVDLTRTRRRSRPDTHFEPWSLPRLSTQGPVWNVSSPLSALPASVLMCQSDPLAWVSTYCSLDREATSQDSLTLRRPWQIPSTSERVLRVCWAFRRRGDPGHCTCVAASSRPPPIEADLAHPQPDPTFPSDLSRDHEFRYQICVRS